MKSVAEAEALSLAAFAPVGVERCSLLDAQGRYLAEPLHARSDAPLFDNSAMDGYALHSADLLGATGESPRRLPCTGESRAGGELPSPLARGQAMRIFTGAPMPPGADSVELQEFTRPELDGVAFSRALKPGDNVRKRAADVRAGDALFAAHAWVGAGEIGLLASQDYATVPVFLRPRVAIVATGDELREVGEPARPGSIVNSNATMLAAQVREAGAEPWILPIARDERAAVVALLESALRADVVVLSGGVSVGDYDVVRAALEDAGIALDFWRVNMKPGKPLAFARKGAIPVLGLPGNPASSFLAFELFARPGLRKMLGDPAPARPRVVASLARDITRSPGRTEFIRVRVTSSSAGFVAEPLSSQNSGNLRSISAANGLVEVPSEVAHVPQAESVTVRLLGACP